MAEDIRPAGPGEFTRLAFLNGRLDLSQAEAVIDVIRSKSDKGMRLALRQLQGTNAHYIAALEDGLTWINAMLEASLDFPDEVGDPDYDEIRQRIDAMLDQLDKMLAAAKRSQVYYEGVSVAICGKPNVGKSSWLNILLQKEKAIVTDIPGTTRDVIEDYLNIRGIPVKLMDTAGIRASEEPVEKIGVTRSYQVIEQADLVILMLDAAAGVTPEDMKIYELIDRDRLIVLVNKEDVREKKLDEKALRELFPGVKIIHGSALEMTGLTQLETAIEEAVLSGQLETDNLELMINARQQSLLERAHRHLQDTRAALGSVPLDCLGVDTMAALEALGEISGKNLKEEAIDRIFQEFCIGK
ncbi:tRNA uridine-5-carboxymethylaminomethyl(34) synthesis GTPase MnmE [Syntrophomonas palmitatica]|uniref:tRNA uridine-5-carboxymethylaminomethyl(34) synthesis GTPase MnmE n=1 Tax=Syntrophomonas palmitatica TaxID=402877 RepID=UPI001FA7C88C|nr:tRNA uridine-5-carboxymethylaminomethyl(34) synthesis GTPase MnmE [Syntrophomonas palmitatica]